MHRIDCLQYCNWSEKIFRQMREGGVDAVHVTIAYHEMFRETVTNIEQWNRWFETFPDLIFQGRTGDDVRRARREGSRDHCTALCSSGAVILNRAGHHGMCVCHLACMWRIQTGYGRSTGTTDCTV